MLKIEQLSPITSIFSVIGDVPAQPAGRNNREYCLERSYNLSQSQDKERKTPNEKWRHFSHNFINRLQFPWGTYLRTLYFLNWIYLFIECWVQARHPIWFNQRCDDGHEGIWRNKDLFIIHENCRKSIWHGKGKDNYELINHRLAEQAVAKNHPYSKNEN